uniref:hypothetical protein n=1 Tax=Calothrix TaxID=1186 RepID=UPI001F54C150|nr:MULTISPECIES: hypothetical protein [Calothrix]
MIARFANFESEEARQLGELISRRRQLVEIQTAEKNRRSRSRGKTLANIEAHIEYLEGRLKQLNQEIEQLTQKNQQWINKVNFSCSFFASTGNPATEEDSAAQRSEGVRALTI